MKTDQYKTSKDYERLAFLAQKTDVVCFVRCLNARDPVPIFDIARTSFLRKGKACAFEVRVRGITYVSASSAAEFAKACAAREVSFIEPLEEAIA